MCAESPAGKVYIPLSGVILDDEPGIRYEKHPWLEGFELDGISAATAAGTGGSETFYDLSGRRAYRQGSTVRKGIYVMRKANGETSKILVK